MLEAEIHKHCLKQKKIFMAGRICHLPYRVDNFFDFLFALFRKKETSLKGKNLLYELFIADLHIKKQKHFLHCCLPCKSARLQIPKLHDINERKQVL